MKKRSFWSKVGGFLLGKGFYMVLLLCVMAIGGSGYYLYSLAHTSLSLSQQSVAAPAEVEVDRPLQPLTEALKPEPKQETAAEETVIIPADESLKLEPVTEAPTETATEAPTEQATEAPTEKATEAQPPAAAEEEPCVYAPVEGGEALTAFSATELSYNAALGDWRTHNGVDLSAELGAGVCAAMDGEVLSVSHDVLLGTTVTLNHGNGILTVYGNLAPTVEVEQGQPVQGGAMIGTVGETALGEQNEGAWVHFAVLKDGVPTDPVAFLENG